MIKTLQQLQEYIFKDRSSFDEQFPSSQFSEKESVESFQDLKRQYPSIPDSFKSMEDVEMSHIRRFMFTSPGCADEELNFLKDNLPDIPNSYTRILTDFNCNGITIGYFQVSPRQYNPNGMAANLIENQEDVLTEYAQKYHLYLIGISDGYDVYVATAASPFQEGEIIAMDLEIVGEQENLENWIHPLAKDFEQFLILAGNLNQSMREASEDPVKGAAAKEAFIDRLRTLGVDEKYLPAWRLMYY